MTKLIVGCTVNSSPPSIQFRLAADFRLASHRGVLVEHSEATPGREKSAFSLGDWEVRSYGEAPTPPGVTHAYDIELRPKVVAPEYLPTSGGLVDFEFRFQPSGRGAIPIEQLHAHAIVDYSAAAVIGAINNVTAAFTAHASTLNTQVQTAGQTIQGQLTDFNTQVQTAGSGLQQAGERIDKELRLLTGYPFQVTDGAGPAPASGPGGVTSNQGAIVDAQMRAVLGRPLGKGGVAGTLAALDRSFQLVDDEGVSAWVPQPTTYAVQTDIGAGVTGEQASLARLAASVTTEITPLVANLRPLILEANIPLDQVAAAQGIFGNALPLLNGELARDGGPRISRARVVLVDVVSQLLTVGILLGMYHPGTTVPAIVTDGTNRWRPGPINQWPVPDRTNVVTAEDEDDFTNYLIAFGRLQIVVHQFNTLYGPVEPRLPTDRGTLIVLLQRAVDAAGEAADAVLAALDSVNLGQDERETIFISPGDITSDTVEDALDLASQFRLEAEALLQDSGTLGAASIVSRATDIQATVAPLSLNGGPLRKGWPLGVAHPRVQVALEILDDSLSEVITNAGQLAP